MRTVYRATYTKLNREVAVKVPPDAVANDPERLPRFTREAQVLASLIILISPRSMGVEERGFSWNWSRANRLPVP
jgi:serine/threonine protein kinase